MTDGDRGSQGQPDDETRGPLRGRDPEETVLPPSGLTDQTTSVDPLGVAPGAFVGPYKLIRAISEGGMGKVWMAERRDTFRQLVALKFAKFTGADPIETIARFEQEREVLGALSHEHIARIYDGGVHMDRPWFAMEYVDGQPINDFCDRKSLGLRERLVLFRQVCDAVTHAHRHGILHRDLKPTNILVTIGTGREPQVKVIDFGIAKAMTQRLTDRTITREHRAIGTFEYMSPEQADPRGIDIDTRTDVYSLGVVLYELLSGMKPFDLANRAELEAQRIIREEDAPTPSLRLSTIATRDSGTAQRISRSRREAIETLIGELRRELEWIPLKAIRKDRERRYGSAEDLSEDIENYLEGRPLVAAPESRWYLMRKFARRHRVGLSAAAAALAALVAFAVTVSVTLLQRDRALSLAQQRESELMSVIDFQAGVLSEARGAGARIVANEIVEQADRRMRERGMPEADRARRIEELRAELGGINMPEVLRRSTHQSVIVPGMQSLEGTPIADQQLRALLMMTLGTSAWSLGFPGDSRALFVEADRIHQRAFESPLHPRALWSRSWVARTETDPAASARIAAEVEAARLEAFGTGSDEHLDALRLRRDMDALLPGGLPSAVALAEEVAERSAARRPGSHEALDDAVVLGELLWAGGAREDAREVLGPVLASLRAGAGSGDLRVRALITLGRLLAESSRTDKAAVILGIDMLREARLLAAEIWGIGHPMSFQAREDLASSLIWARGTDPEATAEAIALLEESFSIDRRLDLGRSSLPIDQSTLATILSTGALERGDADQCARAVALATSSLEMARARLGRVSDVTLQIARSTAITYAICGSMSDAEQLVLDCIAARSVSGESRGSMPMLMLALDLARIMHTRGRTGEAVQTLEDAQAAAQRDRPDDSESRWWVSSLLLGVLEESGADASRIAAQRSEVEMLRAAAVASGQHACRSWRELPWPKLN